MSSYKVETVNDELHIHVETRVEGPAKYTFIKHNPGRLDGSTTLYGISILRYGELWVTHPQGENAVMDLMWEFEKLVKALAAVDELKRSLVNYYDADEVIAAAKLCVEDAEKAMR